MVQICELGLQLGIKTDVTDKKNAYGLAQLFQVFMQYMYHQKNYYD